MKLRTILESTQMNTWNDVLDFLDSKSSGPADEFSALFRNIMIYLKDYGDRSDKIDRFPIQYNSDGYSHSWSQTVSWSDFLKKMNDVKYFNQRCRQLGHNSKAFISLTSTESIGSRISSDQSFS